MNQAGAVSVVVAGGGTAGHIEPALAVADALRRIAPDTTITVLGTARGLEVGMVPERGYPLELIPPVPLPRKLSTDLLRLPGKVRAAVKRTRAVLDATGADVVLGVGGYVALPAYLAGGLARRRNRIPIVVHEANAKAGIANKVGARFATRVLAAVPRSGVHQRGKPDAELVGIPVRSAITGLDRNAFRAGARARFGLPPDGPVLLVFGGSQGAQSLNTAVAGAATELANAGVSVLHAHGAKNTLDLPSAAAERAAPFDKAPYIAVPYLSRIELAYAAADLAICRSGAMTVAEVSAVGLPAFYVPLPHGNGEQELNARPVVAQGGGKIVPDAQLTSQYVIDHVVPAILDRTRLQKMSEAAAGAGHRDAASEVARIVLEVAHGQQS